ncbi:erythrocyte membrane protein 1 [Plasmodium falciparum IGH-CR14]|uniref:Erythrocyte membrane protein 1 n=1 Tax=Plasmodium falciparum IGH-CR14 TaxID=580059 RepID=A0A0L1I3G2_PLAFA|nr:erythrocyte membrane protein 1 [Plasmodium falciparum IGH-CR14]
MFHTYSDFRDLCLGKDIGNDVGNGKTNIDRIFSKNNQTIEPEIWWKTIEKDIGEAMFCVLSYDTTKKKKKIQESVRNELTKNITYKYKNVIFNGNITTLTDFSTKSKFLQWLMEWARKYCSEKIKKNVKCQMSLNEYKNWFNNSHLEWEKLKDEKKLYKQQSSYKYTEETAEDYVKKRCLECNCNYEDLKTVHEIKHNKIILKTKDCVENTFWTGFMSPLELEGFGVTIDKSKAEEDRENHVPPVRPHPPSGPSTVDGEQQPQDPSVVPRAGADHESSGSPGSQNNYSSFSSLYNMLTYGIPIRIGFLLDSKNIYKKPKLRPTKLFRVIDIPQNDYNMPTARSPNREYEDIGINNIYSYKSPKYKTLIEVVLKPSEQTYDMKVTHAYYKDDSNKLTDEEWNQLKHEFIPDYLEDLSNTQPNTLYFDNYDEKPFITKIQDRFLDSSLEEVTYNFDWNIPKHNKSQNNVSQNDVYTGIDLINDKLNIDEHVDIYVEILNRKKNELYGTKHIKENTDSNIFANKNIFCSNNKPNRFVP